MKNLQPLLAFAETAKRGNFAAASRELGCTSSTLAKAVARLEAQLGVRLFHRTTRRVSLTDDGERLYARCQRVLAELQLLEEEASGTRSAPSGTLRIDMPVSFGRMVMLPLLARLLDGHPSLALDARFTDLYVDLVKEGIDVAIRFGRHIDPTLLARRLAGSPVSVVATRGYVDRHGAPEHPFDLARHRCLHYTYLSTGNEWVFPSPGGEIRVRVSGTFRSNNGYALRDAMLAGHGIAIMPLVFVQEDLSQGRVVRMLQAFTSSPLPVNAVYPSARSVNATVRLFIEFLHEHLRQIPGLLAP